METTAENGTAPAVLSKSLGATVGSAPILMVGAGGIGCELLKNLVLSGFKNITIIDLDTIDVTNLNRQFLFHREHVGKSKAEVAKESAIAFVPDAKITAIHKSVTTNEFPMTFYQQFKLVLNALDNRAARSHVNKMCLAAKVPLIESGTSGYLGQVTVIRRGETECYDCQDKPHQKTFPGCTIRNTPSEPIHCIVWSKHLFNQLFGEADSDKDVSPDSEDPELKEKEKKSEQEGEKAEEKESAEKEKEGEQSQEKSEPPKERVRMRDWATKNEYEPKEIFRKLFFNDVNVLLEMKDLWAKRTPPTPLDWDTIVEDTTAETSSNVGGIKDQKMWSLKQCKDVFADAITKLKDRLKAKDYKDDLVWDKDDEEAMDFVAACANIRAHIFGIAKKTRFDIKSMAGNIIPAIATTNAVIAGCIVMEALKVLNDETKRAKNVFLRKTISARRQILVTEDPVAPKPKCPICTEKPEAHVRLDLDKVTLRTFEDQVLKKGLAMVKPDVETTDSKVLLSSDEECPTSSAMYEKTMKAAGLNDGTQLICEDFLQEYKVTVTLHQATDLPDGKEFQIVGDITAVTAAIETEKEKKKAEQEKAKEEDDDIQMVEEPSKQSTEPSKTTTEGTEKLEKNGTDDSQKKRNLDQNDNADEKESEAKKPRTEEAKSTTDVEAA